MKRVPLPRTFMLTGILGFLIVTVYTASGRIPLTWGVAFDFVFVMMFVASVLSITPPGIESPKFVQQQLHSQNHQKRRVRRQNSQNGSRRVRVG